MLYRDWVVMFVLTLVLLVMGIGRMGKQGTVSRFNGVLLLATYVGYTAYLVSTMLA